MSAVIEELRVQNFEGYKEAELKFAAGLNLIRGRNSTGKSTILDAISFAIFGEVQDVRQKLLVSRLPGARDIAVYVKFRSPKTGETVEIRRHGRLDVKGAYKTESRRLCVSGKEIVLESDEELRSRVTALIGTSFRKFQNLVYVKQGKLTEVLQPPRDQMDSVLGITLLRELREELDEAQRNLSEYEGMDAATEAYRIESETIPQSETRSASLSREIPPMREEVDELTDQVAKGESPELSALLNYAAQRRAAEDTLRSTEARIDELLRGAEVDSPQAFEAKLGELAAEEQKASAEAKVIAEKTSETRNKWSIASGRAEALRAEIREHEELLEKNLTTCPTCKQPVKRETMAKQIRSDRARLEPLVGAAEKARASCAIADAELAETAKRQASVQQKVKTFDARSRDLSAHENELEGVKKRSADVTGSMRAALAILKIQLDPEDSDFEVKLAAKLPIRPDELESKKQRLGYRKELLAEKTAEAERVGEELETAKKRLGKLKHRVEQADVARQLADGFEQAIEDRRKSILKRIEYRALDYYRAMTDQHVYSAIAIDPESYEVFVSPKGLTDRIPATRVGGGHQTMIALAVRLALLDGLGFRSLLILDEPTYGIDSKNLPQLESQLGEAARHLSQMILVTHHGICEEEASNVVDVDVDAEGVSHLRLAI